MGMASITAPLNVRVDKADKEQFVSTASELGISPSSAINIFVRKFNECGGFPFDVRLDRERSNTTRLDAEAFDAFLSALDEPMPAKTQELLSRDYS